MHLNFAFIESSHISKLDVSLMNDLKSLFLSQELLVNVGAIAFGGGSHAGRFGKEGSNEKNRNNVGKKCRKTEFNLIIRLILVDDLGILMLLSKSISETIRIITKIYEIHLTVFLKIHPVTRQTFRNIDLHMKLIELARIFRNLILEIVYRIFFGFLRSGEIVN